MFHDWGIPARGWHHISRFCALGYGALQLENPCITPEMDEPISLYEVALLVCEYAKILDEVDEKKLFGWGDGLGGGLAFACGSLNPDNFISLASCNPMVSDLRTAWKQDCCEGPFKSMHQYFRAYDPQCLKAEEFFLNLIILTLLILLSSLLVLY